MRIALIAFVVLSPALAFARAPLPFATFKVQEIDKTLKVGYGVRIADLNNDGKPDIVVADAARVIWFDNAAGWKLRTIVDNAKAGVKADNVALDVRDMDDDGKLDVALGADWQPNNTAGGGSLQWLRQGRTPADWTVHPIAAPIPTLHRIYLEDVTGDGREELLVAPLRGRGSTAGKNFMDAPVQLLAFAVPDDPTGKWEAPQVLDQSTHSTHNVRLFRDGDRISLFTASYEGVGVVTPTGAGGAWRWTQLGAGNQDNRRGSRGSGEVKPGLFRGAALFMAAIEPMHGHQVVFYMPPAGNEKLGKRTVIDEQLKAGHALWCADLDGDGLDEIVAGFREPTDRGVGPGINVYKASGPEEPITWEKHVLDEKQMACEDLACADLNGDDKVDVVAVGRATGNVRIYWNQGVPAAAPE